MVSMAVALRQAREGAASSDRPQVGWGTNLVTVALGTWLIVGLLVDAWAHENLARLETFFTPWHALFYSGFLATAGWIVWTVSRQVRGERGWAAIPTGYGLGLVGIGIFGVGGIGDMIWHTIFGIEKSIAALLSPTHLLLFLGGVLILTTPLRAGWLASGEDSEAPSLRAFLPALLSVTLATAISGFMILYLWAFVHRNPFHTQATLFYAAYGLQEVQQTVGIAGILLTNIVLFAPVLLILRRWRLPFGSLTILFTLVNLMLAAPNEFSMYEMLPVALLVGLAADVLVRALRLAPGGPVEAYRAFAALVPLLLWSGYMLAGQLRYGIAWPLELWAGVIVLTGLSGLGLSLLIGNTSPHSSA